MENSFVTMIDTASSILILLPNKPYFDQVAAGLSLYLSLKDRKETTISCPSPMLVEFNRLISVDKISAETGKKNLRISFNNYLADDIEKVSADVESAKLFLIVIPKVGKASPQKEHVQIDYAGNGADLVILIGGANESHFPAISTGDFSNAKLVHVGTRDLTLTSNRSLASFARPASSVSEIVYSLIGQSGLNIDSDVATNLLAGIEDGSKNFTGGEVTADTFETIAQLLRAGGQRIQKEIIAVGNFPIGSIPHKPYLQQGNVETAAGVTSEELPEEQAPQDWLKPKIFKGTNVS
ncbi:hypothetical protein HY045_02825 [Candidatus Woesebacteria bacterium]|nr:hypothetical protein [Candidatus Woesebacteria bacterium]